MNPLIGSPLPAPQRRGHEPRPCPTRLRRDRRAGQKARSHCCWEGGAEFEGSWKARETLFPVARPYGCSPAGGTGSAPLQAPPSFRANIRAPRSFFARTSAERSRFYQRGYSSPTPICPAVSSLLRPRYDVSGLPPAVPDFYAGFRFVAPPSLGARARRRSPPQSACASRAAQDYISQRVERPAPSLRSGDPVA